MERLPPGVGRRRDLERLPPSPICKCIPQNLPNHCCGLACIDRTHEQAHWRTNFIMSSYHGTWSGYGLLTVRDHGIIASPFGAAATTGRPSRCLRAGRPMEAAQKRRGRARVGTMWSGGRRWRFWRSRRRRRRSGGQRRRSGESAGDWGSATGCGGRVHTSMQIRPNLLGFGFHR